MFKLRFGDLLTDSENAGNGVDVHSQQSISLPGLAAPSLRRGLTARSAPHHPAPGGLPGVPARSRGAELPGRDRLAPLRPAAPCAASGRAPTGSRAGSGWAGWERHLPGPGAGDPRLLCPARSPRNGAEPAWARRGKVPRSGQKASPSLANSTNQITMQNKQNTTAKRFPCQTSHRSAAPFVSVNCGPSFLQSPQKGWRVPPLPTPPLLRTITPQFRWRSLFTPRLVFKWK